MSCFTLLLKIFFSLVCAADNIADTTPFLEAFAVARGSAKSVFAVIDRKSSIDSMSDDGIILNKETVGNIEFKNVSFNYPSRTDVPVRWIAISVEKRNLHRIFHCTGSSEFEFKNRGW